MAIQGPSNKSKTGLSLGRFPAKFKSLIHDMKGFKKDFYQQGRGARNEEVRSKQPLPSQDLIPASNEDISVTETRSLFRDSPHVRSLSIRVTVKFGEPLNYAHSQDYEASSSLQPTEELCEALIRRVDHCSKELITRKDSSALDRTGTDGLAKPLRYEIQVQLLRNEIGTGTESWASRTLRSYQKQPLGTEAAREVILSTHYMVGLFLRHHDEAFVWKDGPVREDPVQEHKTFPYRPGRVQPLASIPRSYFIEKQQDFESIPGYTISLSFSSQNHHRKPSQWHDTVEVHSQQLSPLTLASAENLFFDAYYAVDGVFRSERKEFEALQTSCASHSGCQHCRPHDGDGIEMMLSVKNNVGPLFDNLERTTWARVNVFWKDRATDCVEFIEKAKAAITQVRHDTDASISRMNDFEFYIIELRGRGWTIEEPIAFTLGPETCLCQRTVESLLDRLQTGVADVLRGNAIAVRMIARKRGHFILHKTLVAREPIEKPGKKKSSDKAKAYVLDRLKQRIERDIDMVCKDTCTIGNRDTPTPKPSGAASTLPQDYAVSSRLVESRRPSDFATPPEKPTVNEQGSSVGRPGSRGSELLETAELSAESSTVPQHQWSRVTRDPVTGARLFPLVPSRHASAEAVTRDSPVSTTRHNNFSRDGTTESSFELSVSYESTNTVTTQTTSDSSASSTGKDSTGTSLIESHKYQRQRYHTEGSVISTPRTPDLEFGGSPSIRSSVLMTPTVHDPLPNHELDVMQASTSEVEGSELDGNGRVDGYLKKLYMHRVPSASTPRLASRDGSVTSAVVQALSARKEHGRNTFGNRDISSETAAFSKLEAEDKGSSSVELAGDTVPVEPISEQDTPTEETDQLPPQLQLDVEKDPFSQSKPDFDFSSPLTVTPPEGSEAIEKSPSSEQQDTMNPDPSDEDNDDSVVDSAPATRPEPLALQHQHSKSFGSAGYLGSFHESPRLYGVGLRQTLVGSSTPPRPFSRLGSPEAEQEQKRPGTAM
ncbi:hypothetical protein GQX73_g8419 [Xylaria multiplex]|uniref:Pt repeat family protein n=1 Tax=Xylaria multiplex TaxID=323545 RepID=A0A7C8MPM6_9PEZI|nr:hypothetical protein GQX73_g8419 [Xylaria multiplex]